MRINCCKWWLAVAGVAALVVLASPELARERKATIEDVEVEGAVSSVSATHIQLLRGLVTVRTQGAVLESEDKKKIQLSNLRTGMALEVQGRLGPDGILNATRITIEDEEPLGEIEGQVDRVEQGARQFSVGGIFIHWDTDTRFEGLRDLTAGQWVEVELRPSNRKLIASEISSEGDHWPGQAAR